MSRPRNFWSALGLLVLTLVPVWRCVLGGETLGAWDEVRATAPWHAANTTPWDVLQADSVLEFYGWRDQVFKSWARGHLPLWNPYELNGTPLLANSQSGALYPPHILAGLLHLPTAMAMAILAWAHLFWAGLGVYLLCRRLGGAQYAAFLGAAGFAVSPFMVGWVTLPSVVETVAWIPWVLLAAHRVPERYSMPPLAAAVAMMLLAGHLQFAAYGLIALVCVVAVRALQTRVAWRNTVIVGALGLLAGVLISAPQLLPVVAYGQHSHRRNTPTAEGYAAYNAGALPVWELLSLPDSRLLGIPTESMNVDGATVNAFWPGLIQRGGNFAESAVAVGPVVLLLLMAGYRRAMQRDCLAIGIAGLVGLLLAVGSPLGALLFFGVPGWSATGSPGRAAVLCVLALCLLAGCVDLEVSAAPAKAVRNRLLGFVTVVALCAGTVFSLPLNPWLPKLSADDLRAAIPHSHLAADALALAATVVGLSFVAYRIPRSRPILVFTLACLMAVFPAAGLVRSSRTQLPAITTHAERVAVVTGQWDLLQTPNALLPPNTAELMGIHEAGGYDSIVDRRSRDMLADVDGEDPAPAANGNMMFVKPHFDPAKLAELGVTEVWTTKPLSQLGAAPAPVDGIYRYQLAGPGRGSMPDSPATMMRETAEWVDFEATGPGVLTVRDNMREGWTARIDDAPTGMTADPWPQVVLPRGRHSVRFQYWPPGLTAGLQALVGGLAIIAIYVFTLRRTTAAQAEPVVQ